MQATSCPIFPRVRVPRRLDPARIHETFGSEYGIFVGTLLLKVLTFDTRELIGAILRQGIDVEVIGPPDLLKQAALPVHQILDAYAHPKPNQSGWCSCSWWEG
jgi:hypothetical protein